MNRERLRAFRDARQELTQLKVQLGEMEARMYAPKGQQMSFQPHGGSGDGRSMETMAAAHIQLGELYNDKILRLEMEQYAIEQALEDLHPKERMVVRARYLEGQSWDQVCRSVHFEWSQTHRIHASALRKLEENDQK